MGRSGRVLAALSAPLGSGLAVLAVTLAVPAQSLARGRRPGTGLDGLVATVMRPVEVVLSSDCPLQVAAAALARARTSVPVVDADGRHVGVLTAASLEGGLATALAEGGSTTAAVGSLAQLVRPLGWGATLGEAVERLPAARAVGGLPVVDVTGVPVGWLPVETVVHAARQHVGWRGFVGRWA